MRRRVLLSCYYFSPYRGGEAAVGWKYATGLAELGHDVTVIYGDLSEAMPMKADIERYAQETGFPPNLTPVHVPPDSVTSFIHNLHAKPGLFFLYYPAYRLWQKSNFRKTRQLHGKKPFDIAHHLTIIGFREPGYLWQLGIPFVWGPINGAASMPWGFISGFGWRGRYQHIVRNILNAIQIRLPSRSRKAAHAATKIWAVTEEDRHMVEDIWHAKAETMIETGATPQADARIRERKDGEPLLLVWCGIIEARKALHLVLEAMHGLPADVACKLHVIGDGPERVACERLASELGISNKVHWHGRVPHSQVQQLMEDGHALIHSSVKEGTPHVILEAMAGAMPVICHDACGMGVAVDETSGIKVRMRNPKVSIAGFRQAIVRLHGEPELLRRLSAGAIARAKSLSWDNKVTQVSLAYQSITETKQ